VVLRFGSCIWDDEQANMIKVNMNNVECRIAMAANGYGFVQDGHSYSVAGLAGHRFGGFSLM
jgi:hypothetical protein